jgi:hypothetical protein
VFLKIFKESLGRLIPSKYSGKEIGRSKFSVENPQNSEACRIQESFRVVKGEQAFHSRI